MAGNLPQFNFTDAGIELADIERRRKMAEMLQMQALEPIQQQTAGGYVVPISPVQGLAKLAQGLIAGRGMHAASESQKALAARLRGERSDTVSKAMEAMQGRPEQWQSEGIDARLAPAVPGSASAGYGILAGSSDPSLQALGMTGLMKANEPYNLREGEIRMGPGGVVGSNPRPTEFKPLQTMGANGPETTFYDPRRPPTQALPVPVKPEAVTTAGPTGPQTSFVNPYAQTQPLPQPVRNEMVNLGGTVQPVNPYAQTAPMGRTVSPDTQLGAGVQMRGQNLGDARQRDANAIANANKNVQLTESIRKEFNGLPEVQNYKAVLPIIESVKRAPDTPAGDIDLIYGVGKIMDPNSVVREGELNLVIKSGSPAQRLQGFANYVRGGGRLTPAQRKELTAVMDSRVQALQTNYDAARNSYTGILRQQGIEPSQVFTDLPNPLSSSTIDALLRKYGG